MDQNNENVKLIGSFYALTAFFLWGSLAVYWKQLKGSLPLEILSHRVIWSLFFVFILIAAKGKLEAFREVLKKPKNVFLLLLSSSIIGINWLTYIWAVNNDRIIETSLGYYANPIVNVILALIFFKEKLSKAKWFAVFLAIVAVANLVIKYGSFPWVALALAFSFGFYGLLKKSIQVESLVGLGLETLILFPAALVTAAYFSFQGQASFGVDLKASLYLIGAGVVTSVPLILFGNAAKRLNLSTLGFFQYLAPTINLMIGIFVYHEPFTQSHLITFGLIWSSIAIFSFDSIKTEVKISKRDKKKRLKLERQV